MKLIREGNRKGLPVEKLLEPDESIGGSSIAFIELRNKLAHGNFAGVLGFEERGAPDYSEEAKEVALKQLTKAEEFEVEWYNTAPDVQLHRIVHHRWPGL
ncbi:MAG TPA: hypothetical protein VKX49_21425 [Bryobacteraceae bacterium]|nr:hypothetical protein [Bryobacteraceae bacterium]